MANIFQQYLAPPKSVMDYSAELDQADARKQAFRQNALALAAGQQKFDEYQRERAGENELSRLLTAGGTPDQIAANLAQAGYGKQALAYTKQQQDLAKSKADMDHLGAQTDKLKGETDKNAYDLREAKRQKAITDIAAFTDPQQALNSLTLHEQAGDLAPEYAAAVRATIPQNPADFPKWQIGMLQRIMSAGDGMKYLTPDANTVANNKQSAANNAATNSTTRRGQDMTDARAREQADVSRGQVVQSDNGPVLVNTRTGVGMPVMVDGKAVPAKGSGQQAKDAQSVISLLDMAEPLLGTATHSLLGEGYDRAAAAFGKSTEGAQAAAQLKALEGALIAKQPKMSGPQSDKDVLLYRQMAGQIGDPAVPVETRRAAIRTVRALNEKYLGQQAPAAPTTATPTSGLPAGWSVEVH